MSGPGLNVPLNDPRLPTLRRVRPPAFLLLCTGILDILFWVAMVILHLSRVGNFVVPADQFWPFLFNIMGALVARGITIWAALNIVNLKKWGIGMVGSLTVMLPLAPACCFGVPVGAWMLFVLNDTDVRKHFT
ncbi:hypothetical protein ACN28S_33025 [Cystobacter fuscus]